MKWEKRKGMNVLKHYPYGYSNIGVCGDLGFLLFMYLTLSCFDGFLFTRIWIRKFTTTTCSITYLQRYCPNFWSFAQISCFHIKFLFFSKFHFYAHLPCRSGNFSHLCSYQYICLFFFLKPTLDIKYVVLWTLHVGLTTIVVGLQNTMIVDQTTVTVMFPIEIKLFSLAWCR
jgi:hypothetical protein